jgi:hypothetical protein
MLLALLTIPQLMFTQRGAKCTDHAKSVACSILQTGTDFISRAFYQ